MDDARRISRWFPASVVVALGLAGSAGCPSPGSSDAGPPAVVDEDGDGWSADEDCDDGDPGVNPGVVHDKPYDGVDLDCAGDDSDVDGDGFLARAVGGDDCDDFDPAVLGDADEDGFVCADDCDEHEPSVNRGAAPVCGNDRDDDCDGIVDCGLHGVLDIDDVADVTLTGAFEADRLGAQLAVGDVTADGANDLLAYHNGRTTNHVKVYAGPLAPEVSSDDAVSTLWAADMHGFAVGDLDHDGTIDDVALAAGGRGTTSQAHLWLGPVPPGEPAADALVLDYASGQGNVSVCDVNGDGGDDLLYAWYEAPPSLDIPALQLVHGPITQDVPNTAVAATLYDSDAQYPFGLTVRCADYDADGRQDLLVSSPSDALWLVDGPDIPDGVDVSLPTVAHELTGVHGNVSHPFDVDGDGYTDQAWSGAIFTGPLTGDAPLAVVDPPTEGTFHVTSPGDVDGDGLPDVVVLDYVFSEPDLGADGVGALRIHLGPIEGFLMLDDAEAIIADDLTLDSAVDPMLTFGPPSDLNQDGFLDLLVGAPDRDSDVGEAAGKAFVLFGEPAGF